MNRALTNLSLALLNSPSLQAFQATLQQSPNMTVGQVLEWFVDRCGQINETKKLENRTNMEADWNFDNGVETLINQFNTGLKYATFTGNAIGKQETIGIAMMIVLKAGLFRWAYAN